MIKKLFHFQIVISLVTLCFSGAVLSENSYVFLPVGEESEALEKDLNNTCPEISFRIFNRYILFSKMVNKDQPESIISFRETLDKTSNYNTTFQGSESGKIKEEYILATLEKKIDSKKLEYKTIGVIDILGRTGMKEFMHKELDPNIDIKRVNNPEDLLLLLIYGTADAIFLSQSDFRKLKKETQANLVATPTGIELEVIGAAFKKDITNTNNLDNCLKKLNKGTMASLGIDSWRNVQ